MLVFTDGAGIALIKRLQTGIISSIQEHQGRGGPWALVKCPIILALVLQNIAFTIGILFSSWTGVGRMENFVVDQMSFFVCSVSTVRIDSDRRHHKVTWRQHPGYI